MKLRVSVLFLYPQNLSPINMTQAQLDFQTMTSQITQDQIDLQNQLEMHTADLVTKPLSNDSSVLFLDTKGTSDNPLLERMELQNFPSKNKTPSDHDHDQSPETPPPTKKYEILKDPAFLSSPIYPPIIQNHNSSQPVMTILCLYSLQIASLSNHNSLLYLCIQLITLSNSMIKIKIFSLPLLLKL